MKVHGIDDSGKILEYGHKPVKTEKEIEDFIESNPEILEKDLMIISRQELTDTGTAITIQLEQFTDASNIGCSISYPI